MESLAGDIEAVTAVTPAEGQENVSRWLVLVLFFVFDALALDPAKEALRDAVARLLVILLVTAAEATVPTPPLPPASAVPETGTETTIEDASETTRRAISELRRIGGLTWAELGQLFGVSPQRMHSWASGGTPDAVTEQHLLRVLDVVRLADRGDARSNRMVLFAIADGETPFELLASQKFEEARAILGPGPGRRLPKLTALDDATKAERRPPPPEELIDALNDSVHQDLGRGRAACTVRNRRRGPSSRRDVLADEQLHPPPTATSHRSRSAATCEAGPDVFAGQVQKMGDTEVQDESTDVTRQPAGWVHRAASRSSVGRIGRSREVHRP